MKTYYSRTYSSIECGNCHGMKDITYGWDLLIYDKYSYNARSYSSAQGRDWGGWIRFLKGIQVSRGYVAHLNSVSGEANESYPFIANGGCSARFVINSQGEANFRALAQKNSSYDGEPIVIADAIFTKYGETKSFSAKVIYKLETDLDGQKAIIVYKINDKGTDVELDALHDEPRPEMLFCSAYDDRPHDDIKDYYCDDEVSLLIKLPAEMEKRWDKEVLKAIMVEVVKTKNDEPICNL